MNTDISVLLDRSGSMASIADDTIGGFNAFLKEQQALPGAAVLTLVQFDSQGYDVMVNAKPLAEVSPLTREQFQPRASTPLLDSMARLITETGSRLAAMAETERPSKVAVVVITDGYENASREFTDVRVKEMVTHQSETYQWDFIYLGANQDAILVANRMGISFDSAATYTANAGGTKAAYAGASAMLMQARAGKRVRLAAGARAAMISKR